MCVFLISPVPIAEPLTSELIDTPVFYNLAPRPIKYRVSVPIPNWSSPRVHPGQWGGATRAPKFYKPMKIGVGGETWLKTKYVFIFLSCFPLEISKNSYINLYLL